MNERTPGIRRTRRTTSPALSLTVWLILASLCFPTVSFGQSDAAAVTAPEGGSILGNYVWLDANADGDHLGAEGEFAAGINGVRVNLYLDANKNGAIDPGEFVEYKVTGDSPDPGTQSGWYRFDVTASGNQYLVEIDPGNFAVGGALYDYVLTSEPVYGPTPLVVDLPNTVQDFLEADFGYIANPLHVTKALVNTTPYLLIGDIVTFRITISNSGTVTLNPVPLDDFYSPACLNYGGATITPNIVDENIGWLHWNNLGPLPPGQTIVIDVQFTAQNTQEMVWKEGGWPDYAPKGIPDFDEKQSGWDSPVGTGQAWYRCGPAAAANSLWWFDSKFEPDPKKPPTISDGYPLIQAYGAWDDHDQRNVKPLVDDLSGLMGTTAGFGTTVTGLANGITQFIADAGLGNSYTVTTIKDPTYPAVGDRIRQSEDVILLLGFWQEAKSGPKRIGGHYVTATGADLLNLKLAISDPYRNNAEAGGAGRVMPGAHADEHPVLGPVGDSVHNDAQYISHDVYATTSTALPTGIGGVFALVNYVNAAAALGCPQIANFQYQNVPPEFEGSGALCLTSGSALWTTVEYAVAVAHKSNTLTCSPTVNIAAVTGAKMGDTVLPPVQYEVPVTEGADWGDLPDRPYPTLSVNNGPRHLIVSPLRLGVLIDAELNGQPNGTATGDDNNGLTPSDEDGVTVMPGKGGVWSDGQVTAGRGGSLQIVISGGRGVPQLFADFLGVNSLSEVSLRDSLGNLLPTTPWLPGTYRVYFDVPAGTFGGSTTVEIPMRVRLSSGGNLGPTGPAADGEVEDYLFNFTPNSVAVSGLSASAETAKAIPYAAGGLILGLVLSLLVGRRRFLAAK